MNNYLKIDFSSSVNYYFGKCVIVFISANAWISCYEDVRATSLDSEIIVICYEDVRTTSLDSEYYHLLPRYQGYVPK